MSKNENTENETKTVEAAQQEAEEVVAETVEGEVITEETEEGKTEGSEENPEEKKEEDKKKEEVTQFYAALERLRKELAEKDQKLIEYIQAHKKHVHETDRVRQRLHEDMDRKLKTANAELLRRILPVFDDLERALGHAESSDDVKGLADGVRMVVNKFNTEFDNAGLEKFSTKGEKFNPNLEEAISIIPVMSADQDDIVIEVLEPGYRMGDNLIRPAKVVVGKFSG